LFSHEREPSRCCRRSSRVADFFSSSSPSNRRGSRPSSTLKNKVGLQSASRQRCGRSGFGPWWREGLKRGRASFRESLRRGVCRVSRPRSSREISLRGFRTFTGRGGLPLIHRWGSLLRHFLCRGLESTGWPNRPVEGRVGGRRLEWCSRGWRSSPRIGEAARSPALGRLGFRRSSKGASDGPRSDELRGEAKG
jgi:hypothetical protein